MDIPAGTRFGPYEIVAPLGAGGMGEVYRARDTRLDRTVALKVLSGARALSVNLRERFDREAKAVARLNHPNICTIHDVGDTGGVEYIVMEYVVGETLAAKIAEAGPRGGLAPAEAVEYAVQVARALAAAHAEGVIHRDIKPSNILITPAGQVKVLDFGLAKLAQPSSPDATTLKGPATAAGLVMGTPDYMSPEQALGRDVDARSDLFSLGVVLYEMLSGRRPFAGGTAPEVADAILHRTPAPLASSTRAVPAALDRIVRTLLEKDRTQRYQEATALLDDMRRLRLSHAGADSAEGHRHARRGRLVAGAALGTAVLLGGAALWWQPWASPPAEHIAWPLGPLSLTAAGWNLAISPDGSTVVFQAREPTDDRVAEGSVGPRPPGPPQLHVRRAGHFDAAAVPGTEGGSRPFFSPDGLWVGFLTGAGGTPGLYKVRLDVSRPVLVAEGTFSGAHWGEDGRIVVTRQRGLFALPESGGALEPLASLSAPETLRDPRALPGGAILFVHNRQPNEPPGLSVRLPDGTIRHVLSDAVFPRVLPGGLLVFGRDGKLWAVRFDARRAEVRGDAVMVLDGVRGSGWHYDYDVSRNGVLVYYPGVVADPNTRHSMMTWVDRDARETRVPFPRLTNILGAADSLFRLSPDDAMFATVAAPSEPEGTPPDQRNRYRELWLGDFARKTYRQLATGGVESLAWFPDGRRIAYRRAGGAVFTRPVDFSAEEVEIAPADLLLPTHRIEDISPDGRSILMTGADGGPGASDLWVLSEFDAEGRTGRAAPQVRHLERTTLAERVPRFSRDGGLVAFWAGRGLYVRTFPQAGPVVAVAQKAEGSMTNYWPPAWTDSEVIYPMAPGRSGSINIWAAEVSAGPPLRVGIPRSVYPGGRAAASGDWSADTTRILLVEPAEAAPTTQINLIRNWAEDVRRRMKSP